MSLSEPSMKNPDAEIVSRRNVGVDVDLEI
jgi:hypothetical protein